MSHNYPQTTAVCVQYSMAQVVFSIRCRTVLKSGLERNLGVHAATACSSDDSEGDHPVSSPLLLSVIKGNAGSERLHRRIRRWPNTAATNLHCVVYCLDTDIPASSLR